MGRTAARNREAINVLDFKRIGFLENSIMLYVLRHRATTLARVIRLANVFFLREKEVAVATEANR